MLNFKKIHINKIGPAKIYFCIAFAWGLIMALIIPPFQIPDEASHYIRAGAIAEGNMRCEGSDIFISNKKASLPAFMATNSIAFQYDKKFDRELLRKWQDENYVGSRSVHISVCPFYPFSYLAPSTGIMFGNVFGLSELGSFYIGRIFNLFVGVFIVALAIRIIPIGKHIVFIVGLFPMLIHQMASFNYDALMIPAIILFVSCLISFLHKSKPADYKELAVFFGASILISNIKIGYQPLLFLLITLYGSKSYKSKKHFFVFSGLVIFINILLFLLRPVIFGDEGFVKAPGTDPGAQLSLIFSSPIWYIKYFILNIDFVLIENLKQMVGVLGWVDYFVGSILFILIYFVLISSIHVSPKAEKSSLKLWHRALFFLVFLINVFVIFSSLFLFWTPVGADIQGLQGRYFLGINLLPLFALYGIDYRTLYKRHKLQLMVFAFMIIVLIILKTLYEVYKRYY